MVRKGLPQEIYDRIILNYADEETILTTRFLQSAFVQECTRTFDIHNAILLGYTCNAQWLYIRSFYSVRPSQVFVWAAQYGNLELLVWLRTKYNVSSSNDAVDFAALNGQFDCVKWLLDHCKESCSTSAMDFAAMNGHVDVMQLLHTHGKSCTESAIDYAAMNGRLETIQWLHENVNKGCTEYAMDWAAMRGHLNIVIWLNANRTEGCTEYALEWAVAGGHFDVVKWLCENKYNVVRNALFRSKQLARVHGYDEIAEWIELIMIKGNGTHSGEAIMIH